MIFLFIGMIASGTHARITLLSHRGGWFYIDQARKSFGMILFELFGTFSGLTAFVISFLLFEWWWPLVALSVGYWVIPEFVVTRNSYSFFYQIQFLLSLAALVCSVAICGIYFEIF